MDQCKCKLTLRPAFCVRSAKGSYCFREERERQEMSQHKREIPRPPYTQDSPTGRVHSVELPTQTQRLAPLKSLPDIFQVLCDFGKRVHAFCFTTLKITRSHGQFNCFLLYAVCHCFCCWTLLTRNSKSFWDAALITTSGNTRRVSYRNIVAKILIISRNRRASLFAGLLGWSPDFPPPSVTNDDTVGLSSTPDSSALTSFSPNQPKPHTKQRKLLECFLLVSTQCKKKKKKRSANRKTSRFEGISWNITRMKR